VFPADERHPEAGESNRYCPGMARDDKVGALADVRLFASLNRRELGRLARASEVVVAPAGQEIVAEGTVGEDFYLILAGEAVVRRNRRKIATLGPGSYFGELALLDGGPRTATVVAATDTRLLRTGPREFATVIEEIPAVAHKLLIGMAGRLREADARVFSH
jgi:CRP/FNR family cyclic AMP-dependent transcriptional regulator